jgi:hypothetical protein
MIQIGQVKTGPQSAKKVALEAEKEKDAPEKSVVKLKRQLQPKRSHIHDDDGNCHNNEILTEVDNWDLIVHRRETTHVPNRRNVQVGSLEDQSKSHTGTDGFLCHIRMIIVTISVKVNSEDDTFSVIGCK